MKAIIMAAGKGTRIKEMIGNIPKSTVQICGTPLIENTIEVLTRHNITDVTIVVGYQYHKIVDALKKHNNINFVINSDYSRTNGIYSVWLASQQVCFDDDILLMSGDLYINDQLVDILVSSTKDPVLLTDSSRIKEADFKFGFKNDILVKYGKDLKIEETNGECLGIAKMSKHFASIYKKHLDDMISEGITNLWWESVFYDMIGNRHIYVEDVKGCFWGEIDTYDDYVRIRRHVEDEKD